MNTLAFGMGGCDLARICVTKTIFHKSDRNRNGMRSRDRCPSVHILDVTGWVFEALDFDVCADNKTAVCGVQLRLRRALGRKQLISEDERDLMFRWNHFVKEHNLVYADSQTPSACRKFAAAHRAFLRKPPARRAFTYHLITLWNFSLIDWEAMSDCLEIIDGRMDPADAGTCIAVDLEGSTTPSDSMDRRSS